MSILNQHQMAKNMHFLKIRVLRSINPYYHFCLICILSFMWNVKKLPRVAQSGTMIKCFLKESTIRIYSRQTRKIPAFFYFYLQIQQQHAERKEKRKKNRISYPYNDLFIMPNIIKYELISDASSHLYKRVCPSIGPSVCP